MKIAVYIVTFKKNPVLNANLRSLWKATRSPQDMDVTVLANHPEVKIEPANQRPNLRVVLNTTRSPQAWGYLSRDWNSCLLDGFQNWRNPRNLDWCVLAQNDVTWVPGWDDYLRGETRFDFITQPRGDQSLAFNIEALRQVGFFDERFSTLHFHEFDYFYRAMLTLRERASINDDHGENEGSCWNPVGSKITNYATFGVCEDDNLHTNRSWREMRNLLFEKWGLANLDECEGRKSFVEKLIAEKRPLPAEVDWYPFFWDGCTEQSRVLLPAYQDAPPPERKRGIWKLIDKVWNWFTSKAA